MGKPTWKEYVDGLVNTGYLSHAAIFGHGKPPLGPQRWSATNDFAIDVPEIEEVLKTFKRPEDYIGKYLKLGKKGYIVIKCDMEMLFGRCHAGGCVIFKCDSLTIVGIYADLAYAASANTLVLNLAKYFQQQKF